MLDVVVLFFLLGLLAGMARSELKLPPALYDSLSLVLLLSIGLKGGEGLAKHPLLPLVPQLAVVIALGIVLTIVAHAVLRRRFAAADAASENEAPAGRQRSAAFATLSTFSRLSVTMRTLAVMPGSRVWSLGSCLISCRAAAQRAASPRPSA